MIEEWKTLLARHEREKTALFKLLSDQGITQTEAAARLGMKIGTLNNQVRRRGIKWKIVRQGERYLKPRKIPTVVVIETAVDKMKKIAAIENARMRESLK